MVHLEPPGGKQRSEFRKLYMSLARGFSKFVPKVSPKIDGKERILLYSYHDDNIHRDTFRVLAVSTIGCLGYYAFTPSAPTAFYLAIASTAINLATMVQARSVVAEMYLLKGGTTAEFLTYTATGVSAIQKLSKKSSIVDIKEISASKTGTHFFIASEKHRFNIPIKDGVIHKEDYFYAVLRGLPIE